MTRPAPPYSRAGAAVLGSHHELATATDLLDARGWSWPRRGRYVTRLWRLAADARVTTYPMFRDRGKSWDVWRAVNHCLEAVPKEGAVLDVGAWQSEVLWALRRAGYGNLAGCDTDPRVRRMPGAGTIEYVADDFFALDRPEHSLAALTCLSVIEHGMDAEAFFTRAARLLGPGGRLLLTTDYWPTPIHSEGLSAFGRPWTIASRGTVEAWIAFAGKLGLEPDGPVSLEAGDAPIRWNRRNYTFLCLALAKRD